MSQGTYGSRPRFYPHARLMWAKRINLTAITTACVLPSGAYLLWGLVARLALNIPSHLSLLNYKPPGLLAAFLIFATLVVVLLASEAGKRTRVQKLLARRLALEGVTAELSSRLTARSPEKVDAEIDSMLSRVLESHDAGWIGWCMNRDGDSNLERAHTASALNAPPAPGLVKLRQFPHTAGRLMCGEVAILRGIKDLPVDASMDRLFFQGVSVKSLVLTPSNGGTIGKGV